MRLLLLLLLTIHHCWSKCDDGWTRFERESGGWCVKVFYEAMLNQSVAEARCQAEKATLSGLQNMVEVLDVTAIAAEHLHPATGTIWIGLKRRQECIDDSAENDCDQPFEWTDGVTTSTDGMAWDCEQPNNWRGEQDCVGLLVGKKGHIRAYLSGKINDGECEPVPVDDYGNMGYVCGKRDNA